MWRAAFFGTCHGQPTPTAPPRDRPLRSGSLALRNRVSAYRSSPAWKSSAAVLWRMERLDAYEFHGIALLNKVKPHSEFRGPTRADLPRWLPSALASMWWPPSFTLGDMPGEPGISPGWRSCSCKNAVACLRWVLSRMRRPDQRAGGPPAGGPSVPGAKPCQSSPADVSPLSKVEIDVLIIDQIGKNISGAAMTPM